MILFVPFPFLEKLLQLCHRVIILSHVTLTLRLPIEWVKWYPNKCFLVLFWRLDLLPRPYPTNKYEKINQKEGSAACGQPTSVSVEQRRTKT